MNTQDGVKVCIRARPFIQREVGSDQHWDVDTQHIKSKSRDKPRSYLFDRVFDIDESTSDVYEEIAEPIIYSGIQGFNGTIFAYGQTASGKTYTMSGSDKVPGVIPLAIDGIFNMIDRTPEREFLLRMSYLEIYNDNLKDLLADEVVPLNIRENQFKNVNVQGLVEKVVTSNEEVKRNLAKGERVRHFGSTNMNDRSSRSHTIFKMIIESRERADMNRTGEDDPAIKMAQLNFVDLAGSERTRQTGAEGLRLKEGCFINKSLMVLGQVINQICKDNEIGGGSRFINFRDSKLTRILQPSLGGNSLTAIICTITLSVLDETDSTLRFASSAKNVRNKPIVNEVLSEEALLYRQKKEINNLRQKISELEKKNELNEMARTQKMYEDKIKKITEMLLVSSRPADSLKKHKSRRTWCPGALNSVKFDLPLDRTSNSKAANFTCVSESMTDTFVFEDRTPSFDISKRSRSSLLEEIPSKKARVDDEACALRDALKSTEQKLYEEQEEKKKLKKLYESKYESLKTEMSSSLDVNAERKIRTLQENLKLHENVIKQFKIEKVEDDMEKEKQLKMINELSSKIVDLERREISRMDGDSTYTALQGQLKEVYDQLKETCRENRKLQERCDDETNKSRQLNLSLEELQQSKDEEVQRKAVEYESKIQALQSQLEASLHSTKSHESCEKIENESSLLKTNLSEKDSLIRDLQETVSELKEHIEMLSHKDNVESDKKPEEKAEVESDKQDLSNLSAGKSVLVCGEQTLCLEEAMHECDRLLQEREVMKQKMDDMMFQILEKDGLIQEKNTKLESMKSQVKSLEEQAQFDRDEKEILFAEEKDIRSEMETLRKKLMDVQGGQSIDAKSHSSGDELKHMEELAAIHEKSAKDAEALLKESNANLSNAQFTINELQLAMKEKEKLVEKLQADVESYVAMKEITSSRKPSQLDRSISNQGPDVETTQNSSKELEETLNDLKEDLQRKENELKEVVSNRDSLLHEIDLNKEKLETLQSNVHEITAERDALLDEVEQNKMISNAETGLLEKELDSTKIQLEELRKSFVPDKSVVEVALQTDEVSDQVSDEVTRLTTTMISLTNDLQATRNDLEHERSIKKELQEVVDVVREESDRKIQEISSNSAAQDAEKLPEKMMQLRRENMELKAKIESLGESLRLKEGALLAENNKDLDQQRLLHEADQAKKDSLQVFAHERQLANKEIEKLQQQVDDKQQALVKALSEKDITAHQLDKAQQQCSELHMQVQELEKSLDRNSQSSIFLGKGDVDRQKLEKKFKQISFNLDLTQQKLEKSEALNKTLQDQCKELEQARRQQSDVQSRLGVALNNLKSTEERLKSVENELNDVQELREELKREISEKVQNFEEFKKESDRALNEVQLRHEEEVRSIRDQLSSAVSLTNDSRQDLKAIQEELDSQRRTSVAKEEELNDQLAALNESHSLQLQAYEEKLRTSADLHRIIAELRDESDHLKETVTQQKLDGEMLRASLTQEVEDLQARLLEVEQSKSLDSNNLAKALEQKSEEISSLQKLLDEKDCELARLRSDLSPMKVESRKVNLDATVSSQLEELNQSLQDEERLSDAEKNFITLYKEYMLLTEKYDSLLAEKEALNNQADTEGQESRDLLETKYCELQSSLNQCEQELNTFKHAVEQSENEISELGSKLAIVEEKLSATSLQLEEREELLENLNREKKDLIENLELLSNQLEESKKLLLTSEQSQNGLEAKLLEKEEMHSLNEGNDRQPNKELTELEQNLVEAQTELKSSKEEIELLKSQNLSLEQEKEKLLVEMRNTEEKIQQIVVETESQLKSSEQEIDLLKSQNFNFEQEKEKLMVEWKNTEEELQQVSIETEAQLKSSLLEIEQFKSENLSLEQEKDNLMMKIKDIEEKLVSAAEDRNELKDVTGKLSNLEKNYAELKTDYSGKIDQINVVEQKLVEIKSSSESYQEKILSLENEIQEKVLIIKDAQDQLEKLNEKEQLVDSASSASVQDLQEDINALKADMKRSSDECQKITEMLCERDQELNHIKCEKTKLETLLEESKKNNDVTIESKCVLLSQKEDELERVQKENKKMGSLLGDRLAAINESKEEIKRNEALIEKLKAKICNFEIVLAEDEAKTSLVKLLEEKENLSEVETNFIVLYQDHQQVSEECESLKEKNNLLTSELEQKCFNSSNSEDLILEIKTQLKDEQEKTAGLEKAHEISNKQLAELREQLSLSQSKITELETRLEVARSSRKGRHTKNFTAQIELDKVNSELSDKTEQLSQLTKQHNDVKSQLQQAESALNNESAALHELTQKFNKGKAAYFDLTSKHKEVECRVQELTSQLDKTDKENEVLQEDLNQLKEKLFAAEKVSDSHRGLIQKCSELEREVEARITTESSVSVKDYVQIKELLQAANHENESLKKEILKQESTRNDSTDESKRKLLESLSEKEEKISKLKSQLAEFEKKNEQFDRDLQNAIDESKLEIHQQSREIAQKYIDEYHKIAKKLMDKEAYEKDLEKKLLEVSKSQVQLSEIRSKLSDKEKEIEQHVTRISKLELSSKECRESASSEIELMRKKIKLHTDKLTKAEYRASVLESKVTNSNEMIEKYKKKVEELEKAQQAGPKLELNKFEQLRSNYETKIHTLEEQLRASNTRYTRLQSLRNQPTSSKAPLSGGFVQLTKLDIQELEMTELKQKLKHLEKELAKYMDIEEKRRSENQMLLDRYNKAKSYIRLLKAELEKSKTNKAENVLQTAEENVLQTAEENVLKNVEENVKPAEKKSSMLMYSRFSPESKHMYGEKSSGEGPVLQDLPETLPDKCKTS